MFGRFTTCCAVSAPPVTDSIGPVLSPASFLAEGKVIHGLKTSQHQSDMTWPPKNGLIPWSVFALGLQLIFCRAIFDFQIRGQSPADRIYGSNPMI
jgi:hypothetical protein